MGFNDDRLLLVLWRRKFQRQLRSLEHISHSDERLDADEIWAKIAPDLALIQDKPENPEKSRRRIRFNRHFSYLAVACLACFCLLPVLQLLRSSDMGVKSVSSVSDALPPSNLAFAIVKADGDIVHGSEGAKLSREDLVIFYLETPGLFQGADFTLDITVQTPDGKLDKVVDHYRVRSSRETLKGRNGYVVYRPEMPGIHRFSGRRNQEVSSENVAGFSIERLP